MPPPKGGVFGLAAYHTQNGLGLKDHHTYSEAGGNTVGNIVQGEERDDAGSSAQTGQSRGQPASANPFRPWLLLLGADLGTPLHALVQRAWVWLPCAVVARPRRLGRHAELGLAGRLRRRPDPGDRHAGRSAGADRPFDGRPGGSAYPGQAQAARRRAAGHRAAVGPQLLGHAYVDAGTRRAVAIGIAAKPRPRGGLRRCHGPRHAVPRLRAGRRPGAAVPAATGKPARRRRIAGALAADAGARRRKAADPGAGRRRRSVPAGRRFPRNRHLLRRRAEDPARRPAWPDDRRGVVETDGGRDFEFSQAIIGLNLISRPMQHGCGYAALRLHGCAATPLTRTPSASRTARISAKGTFSKASAPLDAGSIAYRVLASVRVRPWLSVKAAGRVRVAMKRPNELRLRRGSSA